LPADGSVQHYPFHLLTNNLRISMETQRSDGCRCSGRPEMIPKIGISLLDAERCFNTHLVVNA
jgi:hypothetical protein